MVANVSAINITAAQLVEQAYPAPTAKGIESAKVQRILSEVLKAAENGAQREAAKGYFDVAIRIDVEDGWKVADPLGRNIRAVIGRVKEEAEKGGLAMDYSANPRCAVIHLYWGDRADAHSANDSGLVDREASVVVVKNGTISTHNWPEGFTDDQMRNSGLRKRVAPWETLRLFTEVIESVRKKIDNVDHYGNDEIVQDGRPYVTDGYPKSVAEVLEAKAKRP